MLGAVRPRLVLVLVLLVALLGGCAARAKMGMVSVPLARGVVTKTTPIYVLSIASSGMSFAGGPASSRCKVMTGG